MGRWKRLYEMAGALRDELEALGVDAESVTATHDGQRGGLHFSGLVPDDKVEAVRAMIERYCCRGCGAEVRDLFGRDGQRYLDGVIDA